MKTNMPEIYNTMTDQEWFSPSPEIMSFIKTPCTESELPGPQQLPMTAMPRQIEARA